MATTSELLSCIEGLTFSATLLAAELSRDGDDNSGIEPLDFAEAIADSTLNKARGAFLTNAIAAQAMLRQPNDFVRTLALHTQLLACLHWLCEFQVLACVPLDDSVPFKVVSDLCGVPEAQLCRITRLMATVGFLHEPRLGHIAHSPLSAQFVTDPALLDAAMFLSGTAAPNALKMPLATKQFVTSGPADQSAYSATIDSGIPLASEFELRPRLQRQFDNYLACITAAAAAAAETSGPTNPNTQITLQNRTPGTTQLTRPAAVYILHLPPPSPSLPWPAVSAHAVSELAAHVDVLRTNPGSRLVLTALVLLPPPAAAAQQPQQQQGTAGDAEHEAGARVHDLSLLQLTGGRLAELGEVVALVGGICDEVGGGLVVMGEMRVGEGAWVAWEIGYRAGE